MKRLLQSIKDRWLNDDPPVRGLLIALAGLYALLTVVFSHDQLKNDEPRYFKQAHYLTQGFFVREEEPEFINGPGYPLLLVPVMSLLDFEFDQLIHDPVDHEYYVPDENGKPIEHLKWRLLPLRLLNSLFLPLGLLVVYRAARLFVSRRVAFLVILFMGLNPFQLRWITQLMTENVSPLFFGAFALAYARTLRAPRFNWGWAVSAALAFGWLAMVRTMFGYVAAVSLIAVPLFCLVSGRREMTWRAVGPLAAALVLCLPYLGYTYRHTGKVFYWSSGGGELLYWITSPHEGEFGSWSQEKWVERDSLLAKNHLAFLHRVNALPQAEREAVWMEGVRDHLRSEGIGKALVRNYGANLSRVFFNAPKTRQFENFPKLVWTLTGFCFLQLAVAAAFLTALRWRRVPFDLRLLLLVALIYFGGVIMLPAEPRYLIPALPAFLIWIGFAGERLLPALWSGRSTAAPGIAAHHSGFSSSREERRPTDEAAKAEPSLPPVS